MVIIDTILYLSIEDLKRFDFPEESLWARAKEHRQGLTQTYVNIPDPKDGRKILIAYDSIPEQTRIDKKLPSKEDLIKKIKADANIGTLVKFQPDAYNYFLRQPATAKRAKEKAEQFSAFVAIASVKPTQARDLGFTSKKDFYNEAIAFLARHAADRKWHAFKVTTLKGLVKRLSPIQKYLRGKISLAEACKSLESGKVGNKNRQKIDLDQQALLVQLYSDANAKPNFEQVHDIYMRKASEMIKLGHWTDQALISPSTVRMFLTKPGIRPLWYEARHGYQEYRNIFEPVTQRDRPSFANALWVIDGTPSHRYFQHGDKGRYFRFNIFPVLDAHSWCVLGFWLSETENTAAVQGALRSACMVSGCLPHQILYDNSSAIQSYLAQETIDKISVVSFAATAGNARAKIIEPFFHLFNMEIQKFRKGFTHNHAALSLNNRANKEALAKMVKSHELPQAEQALQQAIEDLTIWNNTQRDNLGGQSPRETYKRSVAATQGKQRPFTQAIDIAAFWTLPGENKKVRSYDDGKPKTVSTFVPQQYEYTNKGIRIDIAGVTRYYDIEDPAFRKAHNGEHFTVKYEPNTERWINGQPDKLLLYLSGNPFHWNGQHLALLPIERIPMAVADFVPGTRAKLDERMKNKKAQRTMIKQDFTALVEHTKRNGTYTEVITENAFDKAALNAATEQILNGIIDGNDWFNAPAPEEPKKISEDTTSHDERPRADRLSDEYDKPLPLE